MIAPLVAIGMLLTGTVIAAVGEAQEEAAQRKANLKKPKPVDLDHADLTHRRANLGLFWWIVCMLVDWCFDTRWALVLDGAAFAVIMPLLFSTIHRWVFNSASAFQKWYVSPGNGWDRWFIGWYWPQMKDPKDRMDWHRINFFGSGNMKPHLPYRRAIMRAGHMEYFLETLATAILLLAFILTNL